ncbi:hypothetical protein BDQ12DRAFT_191612 [Crucibulum laeve]|uniref:N-acetyltransferase domain-containing protein n=1 Tax=Crucibulum laeve TaxID=68775 RepID=A0A5C3MR15_9AGAR|nr:hypothetical protein BDQ12DRAFT_191612 [Crucibulum laeve]
MSVVAGPVVVPLKRSDIAKAIRTWDDAFKDDPLIRYVEGETPRPKPKPLKKGVMTAFLTIWRRRKISLTIKAGSALIIATPAKNQSGPPTPGDRVLDWIAGLMVKIWGRLGSAEQHKRQKEFQDKVKDAISKHLGDRVNDMLYLEIVATEPASQGRGYGGALVDAVTAVADSLLQESYLVSSNIANTEFYNSHGFKTARDILIGDQNPNWRKPPVVVKLMVRAIGGHNDEKYCDGIM